MFCFFFFLNGRTYQAASYIRAYGRKVNWHGSLLMSSHKAPMETQPSVTTKHNLMDKFTDIQYVVLVLLILLKQRVLAYG